MAPKRAGGGGCPLQPTVLDTHAPNKPAPRAMGFEQRRLHPGRPNKRRAGGTFPHTYVFRYAR
eukprot:2453589-Lingulodinium_polyedra.AAC.1